MELLRKWDKILLHLPAELCYITPCVAVAHHAAVSETEIVLISHLFRLFRAALHQLVVEVVQFLLVSREKGGVLLPCLHTHCPVRTVQIRVHQGKVQGLAIPVNLRGCQKLVVAALELILLLHQRQNLLVHRLHREFDVLERNLADLLLQVLSELRMEKHLLITDVQVLDVRHHGIIKILLSLIKFICHIDIMPDLRQCRFCHDMADYLIIVLMDRKLLLSAVRLRKTLLQIRKILSYSFHVDAAVRHLLEFHSCLRSLFTVRLFSVHDNTSKPHYQAVRPGFSPRSVRDPKSALPGQSTRLICARIIFRMLPTWLTSQKASVIMFSDKHSKHRNLILGCAAVPSIFEPTLT